VGAVTLAVLLPVLPDASRLILLPHLRRSQKLDIAIAIQIANGNAWLNDLYGNHPVQIATTLHRRIILSRGSGYPRRISQHMFIPVHLRNERSFGI